MKLLSEPEFEMALGLAKALALHHQCAELTPRLLLGGLYLASSRAEKAGGGSPAVPSEDLKDVALELVTADAEGLAPVTDRTMPLDPALKGVLRNPPATLRLLANALLATIEKVDEAEDALLLLFRCRATTQCRAAGGSHVGAAELAVAAYASYLGGELLDWPGLSMHLASNQRAVRALMEANHWEAAQYPPCETEPLPLEERLVREIARTAEDGKRLFAAVNAGLSLGSKLLEREETAVHEAGHAVASFLLRPQLPILEVTIRPAADYAGLTSCDGSSRYYSRSRTARFYSEQLCVALAGGIAQQIKYGPEMLDAGSCSDIEAATKQAWDAVGCYGLDKEFGPISISALREVSGLSQGGVFDLAQNRVRELLKRSGARAESLLRENWSLVERLAAALVERDVLGTEDLVLLFMDQGLERWPGVRRVRSAISEREVQFALEGGVMETREGPVRYLAGDALVTGSLGESWPIARAKFESLYEPTAGRGMGEDGTYRKFQREHLAFQLRESRPVILSAARGLLSGEAGDWIVDYGKGDLGVVAGTAFDAYYIRELNN